MLLCECGELVGKEKFHDYIKTSISPSTRTIGHKNCGIIFNFVDSEAPKRFSSKKELKKIAREYAKSKELNPEAIQRLLLGVDRLKRRGNMTDYEILKNAIRAIR